MEGVVAEAAKQGKVDLSLVGVDSTTARAHHDAAGMRLGSEVVAALEKAAAQEEMGPGKWGRRPGGARRGTPETTQSGKNGDASVAVTSSG